MILLINFVISNGTILQSNSLIFFELEIFRRKLFMQIVPYMPVHPAQLNNSNEKEKKKKKIPSPIPVNQIKKENDDYLFKRPLTPPLYTVEEPPDNTTKRPARMKR